MCDGCAFWRSVILSSSSRYWLRFFVVVSLVRSREGDAREPAPPRRLGWEDAFAQADPVRDVDRAALGVIPWTHIPLPAGGSQLFTSEVTLFVGCGAGKENKNELVVVNIKCGGNFRTFRGG